MVKTKEAGQVYQLKITLRDSKPPIWRRVQVKDCSLAKLHDIIQTCMGWTNSHLHAFEIGGEQYSEPDPDSMMETEDERKVKLSQVVARGFTKFSYTYDFGDNWEHVIQVEKTLPAEVGVGYPCCLAGKRACPPDDCGGPWGYGNFLEALQNPSHPEHDDMREWIGGAFDPEQFDIEAVNEALR
jgi:Plasmid pRiA4b ORF-3-like protein